MARKTGKKGGIEKRARRSTKAQPRPFYHKFWDAVQRVLAIIVLKWLHGYIPVDLHLSILNDATHGAVQLLFSFAEVALGIEALWLVLPWSD